VCDCNYFACVLATRSYLWLQNLTVFVWLKASWLFGIWLQAWVVCDCNSRVVCDCEKLFCVCHCKHSWLFLDCKKKELNQSVITTILRAWLQPEVICGCKTWLCLCSWKILGYFVWVIASLGSVWLQNSMVVCDCKKLFCLCDCNQKLFVVAKSVWVCVVENYLVIWLFMIASLSSVWLQNQHFRLWLQKLFCVCDCKHCWLFYECKKSLTQCVIATILRVWLQPEVISGCIMTESVWLLWLQA
jgi:hypothetical protein